MLLNYQALFGWRSLGLLFGLLFPLAAHVQDDFVVEVPNAGFEQYSPSKSPIIWQVNPNGYSVLVDDKVRFNGTASLVVSASAKRSAEQGASIIQVLQPVLRNEHTLQLSGYIRTDSVEDGQAGLWATVRRNNETTFFSNMSSDGLSGTENWAELKLAIPVAEDADVIIFGLLQSGSGTAWFDEIRLRLTGRGDEATSQGKGEEAGKLMRKDVALCADPDELIVGTKSTAISSSLTDAINSSLSIDELADAVVVSLGEFSHGAREVNELNVSFVKKLHQEYGFSVLGLESNFVSCPAIASTDLAGYSAARLLRLCAGPQKQTRRYLDLMDYVRRSWQSDNPITVLGIDNAVIGDAQQVSFEDSISTLRSADPELARELLIEKLALPRDITSEIGRAQKGEPYHDHVESILIRAIDVFSRHCVNSRTPHCGSATDFDAAVSLLKLRNLLAHSRQTRLGIVSTDAKIFRDQAMASNIVHVVENLLPKQKMIVLAHNAHVRRKNEEVSEFDREKLQQGMGGWLNLWFGARYVVFGTMSLQGTTREPVVGEVELPAAHWEPSWDYLHGEKVRFTDLSEFDTASELNTEIVRPRITHIESGGSQVSFAPQEQYDGMFVFRSVSPAISCRPQ